MKKIIIEVQDIEDAPYALREVAEKIEEGYTNGLIGCSAESWSIEDE